MFTDTKWWRAEEDVIVCDLCPRECRLHEGQRGFCFVRQNVDNHMVLTTYGRSTGFCIDPIEKKPLNHFLPGTPVLSFGTAGCNLGCKFCQNWSISKAKEIELLSAEATPEAIAQAALEHGCRSVAFTYNDPVIWAEYAIDTAKVCREVGVKTVVVSAGYITAQARPDFYKHIDAANIDLKAFTETFYKYITFSKLQPVLDTLKWLMHESNVWLEITNLVIPGENDSSDEFRRMCDWIVTELGPDVPVHFSAFHPDFRMLDHPRTPPETLALAYDVARQAGIRYAYVGNVHDRDRESTYCPNCNTMLIERDWYEIGAYRMDGDRCSQCGTQIAGVFETEPGNWGQRRQPIQIRNRRPSNPAPQAKPKPAPKVDFSEEQSRCIAAFVREAVESILDGRPDWPTLPAELADAPTYGVFITAKRAGMLRACRGRWGKLTRLADILATVAEDSVLSDPRFPVIQKCELPFLQLQASLMYEPRTIEQTGRRRADAVQIGRHGVVLNHPSGRGLLLPQVAVEQGWNAVEFLEHLSLKAELPRNAWLDPSASLLTFRTKVIESAPMYAELAADALHHSDRKQLVRLLRRRLHGGEGDDLPPTAALTVPRPEHLGIYFELESGETGLAVGKGRSLKELVEIAYREAAPKFPPVAKLKEVYLLTQAIPLSPEDDPSRRRTLHGGAVLAVDKDRWAFAAPKRQSDPVLRALCDVGRTAADWRSTRLPELTAFTATPLPVETGLNPRVRRAARAGLFYPDSADEMTQAVHRHLQQGTGSEERRRAVMLPHAGWRFCGDVIGKTLARTHVPDAVIVIGPKHTPCGPNHSVTAADYWEIPGRTVPIAVELRARLKEMLPTLPVEDEAHRMEHGTEVLLPFLVEKNPNLRVLPIVLGPCRFEETTTLARVLWEVVKSAAAPPLFVISSDMNHFANEAENRRRDMLAVDAMLSGDPRRLYDTCRAHDISMCGMLPAVAVMQVLGMSGGPMRLELVDYTNSGVVTGDVDRVVGYAGVVLN